MVFIGGVHVGYCGTYIVVLVYTFNYTLGIVYSLFFSCNRMPSVGELGTNTCLYFHYCNLILVNHLVRPHRVGACGAAAGAPIT